MEPASETRAARRASNGARTLNVPNAISMLRFPLAALFVLAGEFGTRAVVLALAAASDWLDGRLARARQQVTTLGELLDPIADKTFMLAALVTLAVENLIPLWTVPVLLTRDIGVAIGALALLLRGRHTRMPARPAGKIVTWLQFAGIALILLWPALALWVAPPVALAGGIALRDYARAARRQIARGEGA